MYEMIIENWSKAQDAGINLPCPRCGKLKMDKVVAKNSLSRRAGIYICSSCGTQEAIEDFSEKEINFTNPDYNEHFIGKWWLIKNILNEQEIKTFSSDAFEIEVNKKIIIKQSDIDDIVAGALKGGIIYWCSKAEVIEDEYYGEYASEQISRGGNLKLYDSEDGAEYILNLKNFLKGIVIACKNGYDDDWFEGDEINTLNIDSEGCDIIIQCAIFGEIVYG